MHWLSPLWLIENYLVLQGCSLVYWLNPRAWEATVAVVLYWFWAVFLILENPTDLENEIAVGALIVLVWLVDRLIQHNTPAWLYRLKVKAGGTKEEPAESGR